MPIVINTTEQCYGGRMTHSFIPIWLRQSLTRFMSNHKGSVCTNLQYEDVHDLGNYSSNTLSGRGENKSVTISSSIPISRLNCEKMLRNLEGIRLKWNMIINFSLNENAGLIMLATQSNLIGLSAISSSDNHPYDRSMHKVYLRDKSSKPREAEVGLQEISSRSGYEVQVGSFLKTCLTQVMNELYPPKLLIQSLNLTCDYRDEFRKKNYRHPDIFHSFQSKNEYAGNASHYHVLHTSCTTLAARISNLNTGFCKYLESVVHSWVHFIRFLEHTSFRGGDVIYLLSRTTMRRVKFLYEKPPTTVTV